MGAHTLIFTTIAGIKALTLVFFHSKFNTFARSKRMTVQIAIVVQRYGTEIIGGAEIHARQVAEQLQRVLGWQVDVYTTTAKEYSTWANSYDAGLEVIQGVRVHRFDSRFQRAKFFGIFDRLVGPWLPRLRRRAWTRPLAVMLETLWILFQGPYCPELLTELGRASERYQKIIFMTYLYYPTLAGVSRFKEKAILIPLAHEEPAFHFLIVERMLRSVRSMLTNTKPEELLVRSKLNGASVRIDQAGVGFDETVYVPRPDPPSCQASPYVLYLGRISAGKGVAQLVSWFEQLGGDERFRSLRLVLAGHLEDSVTIPKDPRFEYRGFVSEAEKLLLMRDAVAVVNPSAHESLSLIVIEALALKVPVLVNAHCDVLRYYTEEVSTAFGFRDFESFTAVLHKVIATNWRSEQERKDLDEARAWALKMFSWSRILSVFDQQVRS